MRCDKLGIIVNSITIKSEIHNENRASLYMRIYDDISKDLARFSYMPLMNDAYKCRKCIYDILNNSRITSNGLSSYTVL